MANVKKVHITGLLPFDVGDNETIIKFLGQISLPCSGLSIHYSNLNEPVFRPNEHQGQTAMYAFTISGSEAISWPYLGTIVAALQHCGAELAQATAHDIDDGGKPQNLLKR